MGVVGAPHGVRGEVRLKSFTERPAAIADYGLLHAAGRRDPLVLLAARPIKDDMLVVRFEGVAGRDAAAALTGTQLFIDRAALPQVEEEEFYQADLVGLAVVTEAGSTVGRVRAILNFGAGDIIEVEDGGAETRLVAFTRAFVPVVDIVGGRLVVTAAALDADQPEASDADGAGATDRNRPRR